MVCKVLLSQGSMKETRFGFRLVIFWESLTQQRWGRAPGTDGINPCRAAAGEGEPAVVQDAAALQAGRAAQAVDRGHRAQARPEPAGRDREHQAGASEAGAVHGQQALPERHRHAGTSCPSPSPHSQIDFPHTALDHLLF